LIRLIANDSDIRSFGGVAREHVTVHIEVWAQGNPHESSLAATVQIIDLVYGYSIAPNGYPYVSSIVLGEQQFTVGSPRNIPGLIESGYVVNDVQVRRIGVGHRVTPQQ
jgi:hypothetical protein